MADDGGPPAKKARLTKEDFEKMSQEELIQKCQEQEEQITELMAKQPSSDSAEELVSLRESEEKLKQQQIDATRRENFLVMRLTTKEQDMQEYLTQINEFKQSVNPSSAQLRNMLLDPAINLMFQRMKREMELAKEKMEQAQNDMAAWKFTPDSQTGKRLMNKCRNLLQENEELGRVISSGRTAKLEGEIALEKKFVEEMKKSQAETDDFLLEMDEDVEGMQSTIYLLQQQLKEAKEQIVQLQQENCQLRAAQPQRMVTETLTNYSSKHGDQTDEMLSAAASSATDDGDAVMMMEEGVRTSEGTPRSDLPVSHCHRNPSNAPTLSSHFQQYTSNNGSRSHNSSPTQTEEHIARDTGKLMSMETDYTSGDENLDSARPHRDSSSRRSNLSPDRSNKENHFRTANHMTERRHRTPSLEEALSFEGTDVSCDDWSPQPQSKPDDSASPSQYEGEVGDSDDLTRTKIDQNCGDNVLEGGSLIRNGVVMNDHYDSQGDDIEDL